MVYFEGALSLLDLFEVILDLVGLLSDPLVVTILLDQSLVLLLNLLLELLDLVIPYYHRLCDCVFLANRNSQNKIEKNEIVANFKNSFETERSFVDP